MKKPDPASLEILVAIGAWTLHNAQGKPEIADAIFDALLPQFRGRYPHHKLLSNWCSDAKEPLRVLSDAEKVQIYTVAGRLSARLPTGEVLSYDPDDLQALAEALHKRGAAAADVLFAEEAGGEVRAVSALLAALVAERMQRLENNEWRDDRGLEE